MVALRFFSKLIKLSHCDVVLKLTVPHRPIELLEPRTKLGQFLLGEGLDLLLKLLDLAHAATLALHQSADQRDGINIGTIIQAAHLRFFVGAQWGILQFGYFSAVTSMNKPRVREKTPDQPTRPYYPGYP